MDKKENEIPVHFLMERELAAKAKALAPAPYFHVYKKGATVPNILGLIGEGQHHYQIRNSMRYVASKDQKVIMQDLKQV